MANPPPPASPITRQIGSSHSERPRSCEPRELQDAARRLVVDAEGQRVRFGALYREHRAIVVFVRHFLCYTCKEYVEDLAKIPKNLLQDAKVRLIVIGQSSYHHIKPFCSLTGYLHEIYVDPEREIYKTLHMKRGEEATTSGRSSPAGGDFDFRPRKSTLDFKMLHSQLKAAVADPGTGSHMY